LINKKDESYNNFETLPSIAYNCVTYLMDNDEEIWRMLAYSDAEALNPNAHSNLTVEQKKSLIYNGEDDITSYRVFMDMGMDDAWKQEAAMLRISPVMIMPDNYVHGKSAMSFEVYSHFKVNHLSNYTTRSLSIMQRLLEVYNGADISGIGRLFFDRKASSLCKIVPIGRIPYKGYGLIMCNFLLG